jgi:biopolymer transport protein ExbD
MARRSVLGSDEDTAVDLSPMIDCIFLLLIFFMVTTAFVEERGLQVSKPDAAATATTQDEDERVVLEITAGDKILLDSKEITLSDVTGRVKSRLKDAETPVVIRAHQKSHHGTFVSVWDAAKRGGAQVLSFTTIS